MKGNRIDKKKIFIEAYKKAFGNVSAACRSAGIKSRATFYKWLNKYPRFRKQIEEIDQSFVEFVESKLYQKIAEGNLQAIKFYLVNRAKDRWQPEVKVVNTNVNSVVQTGGGIDESDRELQNRLLGELRKRFDI